MPEPHDIGELLLALCRHEDSPTGDGQDEEYHHPWPIIVYRTSYRDTNSDANWATLVEKVRSGILESITRVISREKEGLDVHQDACKLVDLLEFRPISDAGSLEGASHDTLRQLHDEYLEREGLAHHLRLGPRRPFFVIDAEVLADDLTWIKCVDVAYREYYYRGNARQTQRYFGWFKMVPNGVVDLLAPICWRDLHNIAPQTIGGMHLVTWDPNSTWFS